MIAFFKFVLILIILISAIYLPESSEEKGIAIFISLIISCLILVA